MKIKIPFNAWSKERISYGDKCATSRTKKYGDIGDTFIVDGIEYSFDFIVKLPLWFVRGYLFNTEGAESMVEFVSVWKKIHPKKGWIEEQMVWYHFFSPMGNKLQLQSKKE